MSTSPPFRSNLSLDQIVALNDELAAFSRAGVPLEEGLAELGADLPGRLGEAAIRLSQRLTNGESLDRVMAEEASLPPAYRAILTAGMRSGNLAVALEGMAHLLRRILETRRAVAASMIYPLLVCSVAVVLIAFTAWKCFPVLVTAYHDLAPGDSALWVHGWLANHVSEWFITIVVIASVVIIGGWYRLSRLWRSESVQATSLFRRWPTMSRMLYVSRISAMADTLALLIEHHVPLHEAIVLAGASSGNATIRKSGCDLAERIQNGETSVGTSRTGIPAVMQWLLFHQHDQAQLVRSLRRLADTSRRQADWMARWLSFDLPILLTIGGGGGLAFGYALSVFYPLARLMMKLAAA